MLALLSFERVDSLLSAISDNSRDSAVSMDTRRLTDPAILVASAELSPQFVRVRVCVCECRNSCSSR